MSTLSLPGTDLRVSPIGYGSADFGTRVDQETAFRLLDRYVALGGNFLDSAHCYAFWQAGGLGAPERIIGAYEQSRGTRLIIATKGGHPDGGPDYRRPDRYLAPEVIAQDVEDCLDRLQRDPIDLFYLHRDDERLPVAEIVDALDPQVRSGRVRYIGASNWSLDRLEEANAYAKANGRAPFVALQNQWSLARPIWEPEGPAPVRYLTTDDLPALQALNVAVIPYSSTANGYFGGATPGHFHSPANEALRGRVAAVAEEIGATSTQVALAWLMAQPVTVVPLVGTASEAHLEEAMAAPKAQLTAEHLTSLSYGAAV
jgi:aryl-alcohol dehydrogenase-like predicted oxidoreductase